MTAPSTILSRPRQWLAALIDLQRRRVLRRASVPTDARPWSPTVVWGLAGVGIALGGVLPARALIAAPAIAIGFAATRPDRRGLVWVVVAVAVVVGGWRAHVIDHEAGALRPTALREAAVTLTERLPASSPDRSATARAVFGGHAVVVQTPRFGTRTPAMSRGAVVAVTGRLMALGDVGNDARLRRSGVAGRVLIDELAWSGARRGGVGGAIDRFGNQAQLGLTAAVGARRGALLSGMALGTADGIGVDDQDALRSSGLWHLVAASGGNIALVVGLVMALGWMLGAPDRWRLLACVVAICAYVPLAGSGPSIERAGVMGLAGIAALWFGREHKGADALAMAGTLTLLLNPHAIADVGWQLSFAAAAALLLAGPRAAKALTDLGLPKWLAVGVGCTIVATVATAPVTLLVFGQLSVIGLVANALALPLIGAAVWSGTLASVLMPISPVVATWIAQPGGFAAGIMLSIADWGATRSLAVVGPAAAGALALAAALVGVVRPPRPVVVALAAAAIAVLVIHVPGAPSEPRLIVLDIGQGSAALLQDGLDGVLVDAGPEGGGVVAALRKTGVRHLAAVVLSHPAADHDGGGAAVLSAFPTDLVLDGGEPGGGPTHDAAIQVARRRGVRVEPVRAGQTLAVGRIRVAIRWPTPAATQRPGDPNDRAAVVQAQIGALTALIPADAEGNVLRTIPGLEGAVLVVSHHGSTDLNLPTVLAHLHPRVAVISVGVRNTYGHPTASTLSSLAAAHIPTLRTDQRGSIDLRAGPGGQVIVRAARTEVGAAR